MIENIRLIIAAVFFLSSVIFGSGGIAGLFRYPDPYSRLQAGSLCGTTAVFSVFIGCLALASDWSIAARIIVIAGFFMISSPTSTHIAARFAWESRIIPWRPHTTSHQRLKKHTKREKHI